MSGKSRVKTGPLKATHAFKSAEAFTLNEVKPRIFHFTRSSSFSPPSWRSMYDAPSLKSDVIHRTNSLDTIADTYLSGYWPREHLKSKAESWTQTGPHTANELSQDECAKGNGGSHGSSHSIPIPIKENKNVRTKGSLEGPSQELELVMCTDPFIQTAVPDGHAAPTSHLLTVEDTLPPERLFIRLPPEGCEKVNALEEKTTRRKLCDTIPAIGKCVCLVPSGTSAFISATDLNSTR